MDIYKGGFIMVKVSLKDAKADVQYDENQIGLDEIKEVIQDAGFEAE